MLKYFLDPAYPSFKLKNLRGYFTTIYITKGFIGAFALSLFIYLEYFGVQKGIYLRFITSISALFGFYILLSSKREVLFWIGIFIGIFWFYWIGFSFRYYNMSFMIPLMLLFVSLGYGLMLWFIGLFLPITRAILFSFIYLIHPLNFNWFIPQISLLDTFFGVKNWQFLTILISLALFISLKSKIRYFALLLILFSIDVTNSKHPLAKQSIYLSSLNTPQNLKWDEKYRDKSIEINFNIIENAIKNNYDIVVLSESAFALFLNQEPYLMQRLKDLSKKISIVTGALYFDEKDSYNSTYYIVDGIVQVANKVVLVPFGEEVPLPKFISRFINKIIYDGAKDYIAAKYPTDIKIKDEVFRNAICYEATRDELYIGNPKYMIAISNNAWFTPSIEPTLQKLLLRYFSRIHHTVIYHSANMGENAVIRE